MKNEILISIIIPVYNVEKYVERCIDSVINQTYRNIEIIIINDGSTDNSGKICELYTSKDSRIVYVEKENSGVSETRNYGVKISKGKYIAFVDSDDYISPNYVEKMVNEISMENPNIIICGNYDIDNEGRVLYESICKKKCIYDNVETIKELCLEKNIKSVVWGKLFDKSLFSIYEFNEKTKIAEDLELLYKLISESKKIVIIPDRLYFWLSTRKDSATKTKYNDDWKKEVDICEELIELCKLKYPQNTDYAIRRYFRINITLMKKIIIEKRKQKRVYKIIKKFKKV